MSFISASRSSHLFGQFPVDSYMLPNQFLPDGDELTTDDGGVSKG